jgi:hypothetical protein
MKDFIYLDMELLESYMAQKNNGLIKSLKQSTDDDHKKIVGKAQTSIELSTTAKVPFLVDGEIKFGWSGGPIIFEDTETSHKIIDKLQTDNMYVEFYNYIIKENLLIKLKNNSSMEGINNRRYFELEAKYHYIDFDRISKLYTKEHHEKYIEHYHFDDKSLFHNDKFEKVRDNLDFIKSMIPCSALLCNEELAILIDKDCLRGTTELIGYKFGDNATVLGKINKITTVSEGNPEIIQTLNMIQECVFVLLYSMGFTSKKIKYIATPLAIYF